MDMATLNKQHQLRLPVNMEAAFEFVVNELMGDDSKLSKNSIMVSAIRALVMTELQKKFSLRESTQFLNGIVPDGVESVTTYEIPEAVPRLTEVLPPKYPVTTDFEGLHEIFGEKIYTKLVRTFSTVSKYTPQKCKNIFASSQAPYWYESENGKQWIRGGQILPPGSVTTV